MNILRFTQVEAAEDLPGQAWTERTDPFIALPLRPPPSRVIGGRPTSG